MTITNPIPNYIDLYPDCPVFYLMLTNERQGDFVLCKIGITQRLPIRHNKLENQSGRWLRVIHCAPCSTIEEAERIETALKSILRDYRKRGEYYFLHMADIRWIKKVENPNDLLTLWNNGEIGEAINIKRLNMTKTA